MYRYSDSRGELKVKQAEQTTVVLNLKMVQAMRIETEFVKAGDIAKAMRNAIDAAYRKEAQAREKAPDDALIPLRVEVTLSQARTILNKFRPLIGAPSDRDVYMLLKSAINESEKQLASPTGANG
jgi:glutamine synthetase adenylyltransferase